MEPTTDKRNQIIATIIIVALILIAIAYFFSHSGSNAPTGSTATSTATSTVSSATSTPGGISVTTASTSGSGYTIKPIYAPIAPNYKAPLVISATDVSANEAASLRSQFAATQAVIAANKLEEDAWIALGDERKEAGDYAGAAADWQYIAELYPNNLVANANLGDLYTNFLKNYPKAAAAFKAQIAIDPTDVGMYDDLYSLYTNQYPQPKAVIVALLQKGIAANPGATELKADLAKYQ